MNGEVAAFSVEAVVEEAVVAAVEAAEVLLMEWMALEAAEEKVHAVWMGLLVL